MNERRRVILDVRWIYSERVNGRSGRKAKASAKRRVTRRARRAEARESLQIREE